MTDQLSLLPMLDDAEHPTWLLNGKPAIQNDCGVYVENLTNYPKEKKELLKLCKRACDRIAKEII